MIPISLKNLLVTFLPPASSSRLLVDAPTGGVSLSTASPVTLLIRAVFANQER